MKKKKDKNSGREKKVSVFNILLLLFIALVIFGFLCFFHAAYEAAMTNDEYLQLYLRPNVLNLIQF